MTKQKIINSRLAKRHKDARNTISGFVTCLYRNDPLISNSKALAAVKKKFPKCRMNLFGLRAIRSRLRRKGQRIPYQREGVGKFFKQKYTNGTNTPILGEQE